MKAFLFLPVVLVLGCVQFRYTEIPEYRLTQSGPFIVSESPELWRFFELSADKTQPKSVNFLVANSSSKEAVLFLDKALIRIHQEQKSLSCSSTTDKKSSLVLKPDGIVQIHCQLEIVPNDLNKLGFKDSIAYISVPSDAGSAVTIERRFRIEEFR